MKEQVWQKILDIVFGMLGAFSTTCLIWLADKHLNKRRSFFNKIKNCIKNANQKRRA